MIDLDLLKRSSCVQNSEIYRANRKISVYVVTFETEHSIDGSCSSNNNRLGFYHKYQFRSIGLLST